MGNPPGLYLIDFIDEGTVLNIRTSENGTLPDFQFDAPGGADSPFVFQITAAEGTFSASPVTWLDSEDQPIEKPEIVETPEVSPDSKVLTLVVHPPAVTSPDNHRFQFNFDGVNAILNRQDPTIVEKPPE